MKTDALTADGQVVLLLCSTLGLQRTTSAPKPLSRSEWNDLARTIRASALQRPGVLLGLPADQMREALDIPLSMADRLATLMARGGQLSVELERLQSLGIWVITRADDTYPPRLRERLKAQAPPVLFGAGSAGLMNNTGVAIVGSRKVDDTGATFASTLGQRCAASGLVVFSGGARGVDRVAVDGALAAGGSAVVVLADSLEDAIKRRETREHVIAGRLTLLTPLHPSMKFTVAAAMGRNKLLYGLAAWAVVVSSDVETGGTWAGAVENLRANWVPLFVRDGLDVPAGNRELINRGASPMRLDQLPPADIGSWFEGSTAAPQASAVRETPAAYGSERGDEETTGEDLFSQVWPRLATYLSEPRTEAEVATSFDIDEAQAHAWLARGVAAGLLLKLSNPIRFQCAPAPRITQTSLFDS